MSTHTPGRRTVLGGAIAVGAAAGLGAMPISAAAAAERAADRPHPERRIVLITGTSSGFGYLTALAAARAGHDVYASMRNSRTANAGAARELRSIARDERLALEVVDIDIKDEGSVERGVRSVLGRSGRIDVLFNNAGMFLPAVLETMTMRQIKETFETNLFGHLRMNRAVLPSIREQGAGLVVQMTTALGRFVLPYMGSYLGAKWAMEAFTETSRYELAPFGVEFVIVEPGAYRTEFIEPNGRAYYDRYRRQQTGHDARRLRAYGEYGERPEVNLELGDESLEPEEIADAVLSLLRATHGERPIRLLGPGMEFLTELNNLSEGVAHGAITGQGWEDLLEIATGG